MRGAQMVALFFVAAFGSSLDVAAIQAESPEPLDFNHELQTVGARTVPHDSKARLYVSRCFSRARRCHGSSSHLSRLVL